MFNISPRRTGFVSVQNAQTISCKGAVVAPLRTGFESVVAHRVGNMFAVTAEQDGKVMLLDERHIVLQYKDGSTETHQLGRRFGVMSGTTMVHDLITDLKEGAAFKQGEVLAWNQQYFERDAMNPRQVLYKMSAMARVAMVETTTTFEDASAITPHFAKKMATDKCIVRKIRVRFDREIRGLVKPGDVLAGDSILCTIENPLGADNSLIYDEKSRETLADISSATPRSKTKGTVELIEVLYNGDIEDMSPTLKKITQASDKLISRTAELRGEPKITGQVSSGFRVDNVAVAEDEAVIKVYISGEASMGIGDKLTFANQLKSIVSAMLVGEHSTEDGQPIDVFFSYTSAKNRIVESVSVIGTTNALLIEGGKKIVSAYRGKG